MPPGAPRARGAGPRFPIFLPGRRVLHRPARFVHSFVAILHRSTPVPVDSPAGSRAVEERREPVSRGLERPSYGVRMGDRAG